MLKFRCETSIGYKSQKCICKLSRMYKISQSLRYVFYKINAFGFFSSFVGYAYETLHYSFIMCIAVLWGKLWCKIYCVYQKYTVYQSYSTSNWSKNYTVGQHLLRAWKLLICLKPLKGLDQERKCKRRRWKIRITSRRYCTEGWEHFLPGFIQIFINDLWTVLLV
jgi:hypothetical protein